MAEMADVSRGKRDAEPGDPSPHLFKMRRAATMNEAPSLRRRSTLGHSPETSPERSRRRGSTLSDFSYEARATLNPGADTSDAAPPESSNWETIPLAVALFPALAGTLVEGGNAWATDIMLLLLGAIFLNWSVTQPW